jgi:hypothetical protein
MKCRAQQELRFVTTHKVLLPTYREKRRQFHAIVLCTAVVDPGEFPRSVRHSKNKSEYNIWRH